MASFLCNGFIERISYLPNQGGCIVYLSEFKKGFRKKDGTVVDDRYLPWKVMFRQTMSKYIGDHFHDGMLVEVKGEVLPYAIEHEQVIESGYSVLGQCINVTAYPRYTAKREQTLIKSTQKMDEETPDVEGFNQPDF